MPPHREIQHRSMLYFYPSTLKVWGYFRYSGGRARGRTSAPTVSLHSHVWSFAKIILELGGDIMLSQYLEHCTFDRGSCISSNMRIVNPLLTDNFCRIPLKHPAYIVSETQNQCVLEILDSCVSYSWQNCLNDLCSATYTPSCTIFSRGLFQNK